MPEKLPSTKKHSNPEQPSTDGPASIDDFHDTDQGRQARHTLKNAMEEVVQDYDMDPAEIAKAQEAFEKDFADMLGDEDTTGDEE